MSITKSQIIKTSVVLCLIVFVCLIIAIIQNEPKPANQTSLATPIPTLKTSTTIDAKKIDARESLVAQTKQQLKKGDVDISLAGEFKTIMVINSRSLPTYEITMMLRDSLTGFRQMGFDEIKITDKKGEKQEINLRTLD